MQSDVSWPIIHVHLDSAASFQNRPFEERGGVYIVYWVKDRPVAHEVLRDLTQVPTPELLRQRGEAMAAAAPADAAPELHNEIVSLVIPTRDRPDDLRQCLVSFSKQRRMPDEILVVDNGPQTSATREVVAEFAFATYITEPRPGLDYARNAGVSAARGTIIAFCDDDVELHPGWCERLIAPFAEPQVMATTGLVLPLELDTEAQRLFEFYWSFGRGYSTQDFRRGGNVARDPAREPWTIGAGASMAFRASVFAREGLFDPRLDAGAAGCSGDSEMWYRVLMSGGTCRYTPDAVSFHRHRRSLDALKKQLRAYMQGHVVALFVQNERYPSLDNFRRIFLELPWYYARQITRILLGRRKEADATLRSELAGYLAGFAYYLAHRNDPNGVTGS